MSTKALGFIGASDSGRIQTMLQTAREIAQQKRKCTILFDMNEANVSKRQEGLERLGIRTVQFSPVDIVHFASLIAQEVTAKTDYILFELGGSTDPLEHFQVANALHSHPRMICSVSSQEHDNLTNLQSYQRWVDLADIITIDEDNASRAHQTLIELRQKHSYTGISFPYVPNKQSGILEDIQYVLLSSARANLYEKSKIVQENTLIQHVVSSRKVTLGDLVRFFASENASSVMECQGIVQDEYGDPIRIRYIGGKLSYSKMPIAPHSFELTLITRTNRAISALAEFGFTPINSGESGFLENTPDELKNATILELIKKYPDYSEVTSLDDLCIDYADADRAIELSLEDGVSSENRAEALKAGLTYRLNLTKHLSCLTGKMTTSAIQSQVLAAFSIEKALLNNQEKQPGRWSRIGLLLARTGYQLCYYGIFGDTMALKDPAITAELKKVPAASLYFYGLEILRNPTFGKSRPEESPTMAAMIYDWGCKNERNFDTSHAISTMIRVRDLSYTAGENEWGFQWEKAIQKCISQKSVSQVS